MYSISIFLFYILLIWGCVRTQRTPRLPTGLCFDVPSVSKQGAQYKTQPSYSCTQQQAYIVATFQELLELCPPLVLTYAQSYFTITVWHYISTMHAVLGGPIYKISYDLSYDYRKFIVRSTYDSDLICAEISLIEYRQLNYDTIFDDIMILHMNLTYEKLSIHCKMLFVKQTSVVS